MPLVETARKRAVTSPQFATWWAPSLPRGNESTSPGSSSRHSPSVRTLGRPSRTTGAPPRRGGSGTDRRPRRARSPRCWRRGAGVASCQPSRARCARKPGCSRCWSNSGSKMLGMARRFAPPPLDPSRTAPIKCGHDLSTTHPPPAALLPAFAALVLVGLVLAGCGSSDTAGAVAGAAGTDGRAAQAFPASTARSSTPTSTRTRRPGSSCSPLGARFPSWPKFAGEIQKGMNDETGGDRDARAAALLARPRGGDRRARRARPTARDPTVLGVRRGARQRRSSRRAVKKDKDTKVLGQERRLRPLRRQRRRDDRDLVRHGADLELAGRGRGRDRPPRRHRRRPGRRVRLPGHDVEAARPTTSSSATRRARRCRSCRRRPQERSHRALAGRLVRAARQDHGEARRRAQPRLLASARPRTALRIRGTTLLDGDAKGLPGAVRAEPARPRARQLVARGVVRRHRRERQERRRPGARLQPGRERAGQAGPRPCSASRSTTSTR